ncbi:MAG: hypothetical protein J3K34DRAFT_525490 [Monoraphidium minutum]|nr:MAG: hypothetical protein J3K34DRAFT_525490 [Monoraphidium minutum]
MLLGRLVSSLWSTPVTQPPTGPQHQDMTVEVGAAARLSGAEGDEEECPITSCKRRGPDDGTTSAKRQRLPSATDGKGSCTDFQRQQDQRQQSALARQGTPDVPGLGEEQQQQQQQQQEPQPQHVPPQAQAQAQPQLPPPQRHASADDGAGKARSPLGHILTPVYYLLQQGSQHIAQHFGGTPGGGAQHPQHGQQAPEEQQHRQGSAGAAVAAAPAGPAQQEQQQQQEQQAQRAANGGCATSTTSTVTTGSVLNPEASDSVAGGGAPGAYGARPGGGAADSGCDSDAEGAGDPACAGAAVAAAPPPADADDDDDEEWFDPLLFISRLPPAAPPGAARPGALLPRRTRACKAKTLVLDLDETLVHSTLDGAPGSEGAHFHFPVHFNGAEHQVHVRMRPHMRDFLEHAAELFEVVVFTASQKVYAEKLLNILDPTRRLVRHRIYRDSCVFVEGNYLKDLSGLGRDLAHTAIVDNSPQAFGFQVDNGIPIESWYDDDGDTELLALLPLLRRLAGADDVRPVLRERFRLRERVEGAAAVWRSRVEQEALAAAAWRQQQGLGAAQQRLPAMLPPPPQAQVAAQHQQLPQQQAQQPGSGMMQQALPVRQSRLVAAAAAAMQPN